MSRFEREKKYKRFREQYKLCIIVITIKLKNGYFEQNKESILKKMLLEIFSG